MDEFFTTGDVAKDVDLTTMGVLQAVRRCDLIPVAKTRSGMNLFRLEDVERFKSQRKQRAARRGR